MAIYVSGGGVGSGVFVCNAHATARVALFTTPNVPNQMCLITVQTRIDEAIHRSQSAGQDIDVFQLDPNRYVGTVSDGVSDAIAPNNDFGFNQVMKVGPNAVVEIAVGNQGQTNADGKYSYQYVSIIMDTN